MIMNMLWCFFIEETNIEIYYIIDWKSWCMVWKKDLQNRNSLVVKTEKSKKKC